eukprot:CAMPEP_0114976350 /NCGR_PEP_ID=MMETSP0216-20121206/2620_1 /TAXON_ID=223996 /ORGANISM="Protocruzia adherens, Strain Boccale" /LENGTH=160 /DNA_ID=CAMNT_0002337261 /DNA_START=308 /DNA_END=785 /DNA_ORIENTATION=-
MHGVGGRTQLVDFPTESDSKGIETTLNNTIQSSTSSNLNVRYSKMSEKEAEEAYEKRQQELYATLTKSKKSKSRTSSTNSTPRSNKGSSKTVNKSNKKSKMTGHTPSVADANDFSANTPVLSQPLDSNIQISYQSKDTGSQLYSPDSAFVDLDYVSEMIS